MKKVFTRVLAVFIACFSASLWAGPAGVIDARPTEPMLCVFPYEQISTPSARSTQSSPISEAPVFNGVTRVKDRFAVQAKTIPLENGQPLKLPELEYEPPPYVDGHVPWSYLREKFAQSKAFGDAKILSVEHEPLSGGMAETHKVVIEKDGKVRTLMVKVFSRHNPFFSAVSGSDLSDKTVALMVQRHFGIQNYLVGRLQAHSDAGEPLNVRVAAASTEPTFVNHGILVQEFIPGSLGQAWEGDVGGKGYRDFWKFVNAEDPVLSTGLGRHLGPVSPKGAEGSALGIDIGRRWDNFIWTGPQDDVEMTTLIDW
ncbi:MAG: hypothetical protein R3B54_16455 [Bdellovibrionota bacterium]